ncbi:MAG TPA: YjbE family putative metal transport protein [Stellaceae bacterium]|nr:YjbE family putative metal transport protein [Stellaceae bacterium]
MSLVIDADWADAASIFGQVLLINVVLSGDNAVVVAMAVTGLPGRYRLRALWLGIALATGLRVFFALAATRLLQILGLTLAGGILLLWVAWKLWRELSHARRIGPEAELDRGETKSLGKALWQIVLADVSMSLDNALAVAGVALDHPMMLFIGLATSVLLMGLAAAAIARLLERWRWIAYLGLAVIVYVALKMIWTGTHEVISTIT